MVPKFLIVRFLTTSAFYFLLAVATSPIVTIKNGTIRGTIQSTEGSKKQIIAFQGIPYARPPIGNLRFQEPQPPEAWKGILIANNDEKICTQKNPLRNDGITGSEDCLYLNVYLPKMPNASHIVSKSYPVMVWIHGGGFYFGSGSSKAFGAGYLLKHDIVLVTFNYRLGPLGFLSTEDVVLPGNFGMKDQVQALRWVNENIAKFGGDTNRITIFGESAGGASTNHHMLSPLSKGLFHRAISQSGTSLATWAIHKPGSAKKLANHLGELLNCPTNTSIDFLSCMREKDANEIMNTDTHFKVLGIDPLFTFKPVIEPDHPGAFLSEEPFKLITSGKINDVAWLTGVNSHEGSLRVALFSRDEESEVIEKLNKEWTKYAPISLIFNDEFCAELLPEISNRIREFYFDSNNITKSAKEQLINMYSDALFNIGLHQSIKAHLTNFKSPVYNYFFAYRGMYSTSNIVSLFEDFGVNHADDLMYLFPISVKLFGLFDLFRSYEDVRMIDVMTSLWFNFAKTGNPTPLVTGKFPEKWLPVHSDELEYFDIRNSLSLKMSKNYQAERMRFWDSIYKRDV